MQTVLRPFRPGLLAAAIALGVPMLASAQDYRLPAAPLADTLSRIAADAGIVLSIDPGLTAGKTAQPVQGDYAPLAAMGVALNGSGLQLVQGNAGTYSLQPVPQGAMTLPSTNISGTSVAAETAWGPTTGYLATRTAAGTKTDTALAEAPRSISVATRQQMEDRNVQNLEDVVRYMPGVTSSSYGSDARYDWLRVRGFEPTQYLDGLALPKGVYVNPKLETWDLERVAMLRGPASSVYGQTPPGGLLDMVSRRPEDTQHNEVKAQVGSYNRKQVMFDSTGPLDDDGRLLYRVTGLVRDGGTQIEHVDDQRYNIAPSLTWNIDDDTKLTFLSMFNRDDTGITSQFLPVQGTKLPSPTGSSVRYHKYFGDADWENYDKTYYALGYAFEHRFNDTWQFRQNLRYTKSDLSSQMITVGAYPYSQVQADGTLPRSSTIVEEDISQFAVDNNLQGNFDTGAIQHTVLMGLDHQRSNTNYLTIFGSVPDSNVNNPVYGVPIVRPPRSSAYLDYDQKMYQTGVYLQDQMALDHWRLTLGGREDWVHTGTLFHNQGDATNSARNKAFTGNAALSYVFDSGLAPYLSYAESFQPVAGADMTSTSSFKPTEGRQWELGVKFQPVGSNTLLTAAVYDLRQKNVSVTNNVGGISVTSQTGEVQVRGLELEAITELTENLKVTATYSRTLSKVLDGQYEGNRLQLIPENQATAWADYTWHSGLLDGFGVAGGVRYTGDRYGDQANTYLGHTGSYTVYDAAAHYDLGRVSSTLKGASLAVNATNVTDKKYLSACDSFYCYYGDRRAVTVSASYAW